MTQIVSPASHGLRLLVIFNPTAGGRRRRRFEATLSCLRAAGCRLEVCETAGPGDGEAIARRASREDFDRVVAAGGDGTINEVLNGLAADQAGALRPADSRPPLAIIPMGTANVLAAELGLPKKPSALAEFILRGSECSVGLGRLSSGVFFGAMVGVGIDAHVVAGVDVALKRRIGKGAYALEGLRQLFAFPYPGYRVTVDDAAHEAAWVILTRSRFFAGRFVIAPKARIDDGLLHVCLFQRRGTWAMLRYALAQQFGRLQKLPDYHVVTGRRVSIDGPPGDPLEADGDIAGELPITIDLVPDAIGLIMPPAD
jgi:YegS/Rv2252/BmrU family lipid kinase